MCGPLRNQESQLMMEVNPLSTLLCIDLEVLISLSTYLKKSFKFVYNIGQFQMSLDFLFSLDHGLVKKDHHGVLSRILMFVMEDIDGLIGGVISKTEEILLLISQKDGRTID